MVILKCSTGELKGLEKGYPGIETAWLDDLTYRYKNTVTGKEVAVQIMPDQNNSFRLRELIPVVKPVIPQSKQD